jgi:hypothetical protein
MDSFPQGEHHTLPPFSFLLSHPPSLPNVQPLWGSFPELPHGQVFACFMTACLIGGTLVSPILARTRVTIALRNMFAVAAASLLLPAGVSFHVIVPHFLTSPPCLVVGNLNIATSGFMIFEVCCGLFWPLMGMQRSETIPEDIRSTVLH